MKETIICVHCGADCGKNPVWDQGKPFCCHGCKSVYQLLNGKQLYTYYNMEDTPGIKVDVHEFGKKYAYLDNADIVTKLLEFQEDGIAKVTLYVPAIHCSSCIWLLENLQRLHPGIIQSTVNFVKKRVSISYRENQVSLRQLVELLASIHYIPQITIDDINKKAADVSTKTLIYKIGVAGFVFGNTMLLSFPEYLPGNQFITEDFKRFFGILNFLLSLPIMFYSGTDYLASGFKNLLHKIINIDLPISIGMIAIFLESSYEIFSGSGTGYMDSLAGLVFFLLIGKWYQAKTYKALSFDRDFNSYFPIAVTKLNAHSEEESVLIEKIAVGDRLLIRNQELIPADALLLKGEASIDYAFVTGEARPVSKSPGDKIYAGGRLVGQSIEIELIKEVKQSRLTQIWNQEHKKTSVKTLSDMMDDVSKYFTVVVLSISILSGIMWLFINPLTALFAFTSVLIVACPCALALSIPFTFGNTMRIFGQKGLFIKNPDVVEALSKVDTIVFDKTGTITESNEAQMEYSGIDLGEEYRRIIYSMTGNSTHPASKVIHQHLQQTPKILFDKFEEIPAKGIEAEWNKKSYKLGSASFIGTEGNSLQNKATTIYFSENNQVLGYFTLRNKYRQGLELLIQTLKKEYEIHFLSGDNDSERENLERLTGISENIHFNQSPKDKLDYIRLLRAKGKRVMMIGDGLNDAGALLESNAGISIADDIYSFSPACDAILQSNNLKHLNQFIRFSRISVKIVRLSFILSFIYNVVGLSFAVRGLLSPIVAAILMPASSVSVVAFVTLMVAISARIKLKCC